MRALAIERKRARSETDFAARASASQSRESSASRFGFIFGGDLVLGKGVVGFFDPWPEPAIEHGKVRREGSDLFSQRAHEEKPDEPRSGRDAQREDREKDHGFAFGSGSVGGIGVSAARDSGDVGISSSSFPCSFAH